MALFGPDGELLEAGSPSGWLSGYPLRAGGPRQRHREGNAAQCRGRTAARPPNRLIVDFSFSSEQIDLRQNVRRALEREFAVTALRASNELAAQQRSTMAGRRWAALAALGAPALLVPGISWRPWP